MLLYFNKNGRLLEYLQYGPNPRVGTTVFSIFAYFQGIDLDNYSSAMIKFQRPDLEGTKYEGLYMSDSILVFNSNIQNSIYFVNQQDYRGYIFNFNSVIDENSGVVKLLDTPGMWEATITLINKQKSRNVVGLVRFYVEGAVSEADDDAADLSCVALFNSLAPVLSGKLDKNSNSYLRFNPNFVEQATNGNLLLEQYYPNVFVYDGTSNIIYVINSVTPVANNSDYVYATFSQVVDLSSVIDNDAKLEELKQELLACIEDNPHHTFIIDTNSEDLDIELENVAQKAGVVLITETNASLSSSASRRSLVLGGINNSAQNNEQNHTCLVLGK